MFMRLSVFRGGFTAEAAQVVARASTRHLRKLVDKALLQLSPHGRYEIHELLRQYGEAQLEAAGQSDAVRDTHSHYYGDLFYARRADQYGPGKAELLSLFTAELDNIRASWAWAVEHGLWQVIDQLVELLWMYHTDYSTTFELGAMCQAASDALSGRTGQRERALLGRVLARQGKGAVQMAQFGQAEALLRQSMAIAREQNDEAEYYYAQRWLASYVLFEGGIDVARARQMLEECAAFYRERGDKYYLSVTLTNLADVWRSLGDQGQRRACLLENYQLNREIDYPQGIAEALHYLGILANDEGAWAEAEQLLAQAMEYHPQLGSTTISMSTQALSGWAVLMHGDLMRARQFSEAALALRHSTDIASMREFGITVTCRLQQSLIADASGSTGYALEMVEEARSLAQQRGTPWPLGELAHAWALCSLKRFDTAFQVLSGSLSASRDSYVPRSDRLFLMSVSARLLAHQGDLERAAELLGLVFTHPNGPRGYLEKHPGMTQLCRDLEIELGPEAYQAAWERGTAFDLDTVFAQLIAEYAGEVM